MKDRYSDTLLTLKYLSNINIKFCLEEPKSNRSLGRPGLTWKDNIKMKLRDWSMHVCELDWTELAQRKVRSWDFMNTVIYLQVHRMWGIFHQMSNYELLKNSPAV
jgi:hypothetical protein